MQEDLKEIKLGFPASELSLVLVEKRQSFLIGHQIVNQNQQLIPQTLVVELVALHDGLK